MKFYKYIYISIGTEAVNKTRKNENRKNIIRVIVNII